MATGLRKLIYIPNEEAWQEIRASARERNRSVSNYFVTLHRAFIRARDKKELPTEGRE